MSQFKKNAFTYATIVALGGFVFGLDAALISGAFKFITAEFNLNEWQVGALGFGPGIGVIIALPLAAWASNAYGRKATLKMRHCISSLLWVRHLPLHLFYYLQRVF